MRTLGRLFLTLFFCLLNGGAFAEDTHPQQIWSPEQIDSVLDNTLELRLAPDISHLSKTELATIESLKKAGQLLHELYLLSLHKNALSIRDKLQRSSSILDKKRLVLFDLFSGPIGTTLDNQRIPLLNTADEVPGKNFYPWGISRDEVEQHLKKYPDSKTTILHTRKLVRRATRDNLNRDLAVLKKYPVLDTLHLGLSDQLHQLNRNLKNAPALYAVPYAVAYANRIIKAYTYILEASNHIKGTDSDFSDYLRNRARDLLTDDYESGDAAWISGRFGNINAQIGSYETYKDTLYGVKAAFSMNILIKDQTLTQALLKGISNLQEIENALPYTHTKNVKNEVPIGVYHVLTDYGQSRGTNTASILPNESYIIRKYGRIILMRYNILTNQDIYGIYKASWDAVMAEKFRPDLDIRGNYERTLWHEIGHYLGVELDKQGRALDVALEDNSNLYEELKADLASLFAHHLLYKKGRIDQAHLRMVYASGIRRTLQNVKPRRTQPYQTMQLMTMNYFLKHGALSFNAEDSVLQIDYQRYPDIVTAMLKKVLDIQYQGDKTAADRFIEQYATWDESLHEILAKKMRDTRQPRYRLVRYAALGEEKMLPLD